MTERLEVDHRVNSLVALASRFPDLAERLAAVEPASRLIVEQGRPVNIDLGGCALYPMPEPAWSDGQLAEFARDPERIGFFDPSHTNLSTLSLKLLDNLRGWLRDQGMKEALSPRPVVDVGFLFVFGVGLGSHLQRLIETTAARRVILIEPFEEFLCHALAAVDWATLFETAERRGVTLHFVIDENPETLARRVEAVVANNGNTFLDGSAFYPAYHAWILQRCYQLLREQLKCHYNSSGFFEDEMAMIENTAANLAAWPMMLIEDRPHLEQDHPVFIIGAGPSLDRDLETIRRLRDRALVISCGTALGVLLKNGVRPDLHAELERADFVYDLLAKVEREHGLEGVGLIASTTIDPRIGSLFSRRWFFYRAALSPAKLLAPDIRPLHGAEPLCCNAAFAAALALGFRNITFFGLDLAQKEAGRHHAKDSLYFEPEHADWDELYRKRFDRRIQGNFGGEVTTWWAFDSGRKMLGAVQSHYRANLVNCSDGARIEGAKAKASSALTIPKPRARVEDVLLQVERQLRRFAAGGVLRALDLEPYIASCQTFVDEIEAILERHRSEGGGFFALERDLHVFFSERAAEFRGVASLGQGSAAGMIRLGHFFGCRIADEVRRGAFFTFFTHGFAERCREMAERTAELLTRIRDDAAPHAAIAVAD